MNLSPSNPDTQITRYEALAAADASGLSVSPAALLVEGRPGTACRLLAVGTPDTVRHHPAWTGARAVSLPGSVILPGLVNAHTHLDLTHIGPKPHDPAAGFVAWVEAIRTGRHVDPEGIAESVRKGIALSLAGGTVAVGDIAGAPMGRPSLAPFRALSGSPLLGVSFVEYFGIGNRLGLSQERLRDLVAELGAIAHADAWRVRPGLQPHAPNTVDLSLYRAAADHARELPLATHLAETAEEREFIGRGTGPQREMLERLGIWDESILANLGRGLHPVGHLAAVLGTAAFLVAHVNDCDDSALATLAATGTTVAYCPRASAYFGAERVFGAHRYLDMLRAGINVALGTDSIVNLPPSAADPASGGMSILDEVRFLYERDRTDPFILLGMATVNGAAALRLPASAFLLAPGNSLAGLIAVEVTEGDEPLRRVLESRRAPRLLFAGRAGAGV